MLNWKHSGNRMKDIKLPELSYQHNQQKSVEWQDREVGRKTIFKIYEHGNKLYHPLLKLEGQKEQTNFTHILTENKPILTYTCLQVDRK